MYIYKVCKDKIKVITSKHSLYSMEHPTCEPHDSFKRKNLCDYSYIFFTFLYCHIE